MFEVRTWREVFATPEGSGTGFVALNPDGSLMASCAWGGHSVDIWDTKTGGLLTRLRADSGVTDSADLSFSPDGRRLLTVGMTGCALWEVVSSTRLWTRPRADLPFAMFSPDGAYVLHRDRKSFLEVLASGTGKLLGQLEMPRQDHADSGGAALSPDGAFLAVHPVGTRELVVWHLREVRQHLARLGLDWELPPLTKPGPANPAPPSVRFISDRPRDPAEGTSH